MPAPAPPSSAHAQSAGAGRRAPYLNKVSSDVWAVRPTVERPMLLCGGRGCVSRTSKLPNFTLDCGFDADKRPGLGFTSRIMRFAGGGDCCLLLVASKMSSSKFFFSN